MTIRLPFTHPRLDEIAAFTKSELSPGRRDRVAAHLRHCVRCQESLRFVRRLGDAAPSVASGAPPGGLLERALASRAGGERHIMPAPGPSVIGERRSRRAVGAGIAAAVILGFVVIAQSRELTAVAADSDMRTLPEKPRAGDTIRVTYTPSAGLFPKTETLVLRARFRTPADEMYVSGVPASQVRAVAELRRGERGSYAGSFVLPKGVVFASLIVETTDASVIDANSSRYWEVLTHGADGRPAFDALDQRVNDMMGRSWEEGYATALQLTQLYPDRIGSWSLREFFERALYGSEKADSIGRVYSARVDSLIAAARLAPAISEEDMGTIFFRAFTRTWRDSSASAGAERDYWWDRIRREYPRHRQVAQYHATLFTREDWEKRPGMILDSLERVLSRMAPIGRSGRQLATVGMQVASRSENMPSYRRWLERYLVGEADSTRRLTMALARRPAFRAEGMDRLRALLRGPDEGLVPVRTLSHDAAAHQRRLADARREVLVALGRALVAEGRAQAGIDTLNLAARGVWDVEIFQQLSQGYLAAGDTASARQVRVRLAVDPRTPRDSAAAIAAEVRARRGGGDAGWDSTAAAARREMHQLLLARSSTRSLRGVAKVRDEAGRVRTLDELAHGQPAVVIFWSINCGAAIEALPRIKEAAERLVAVGIPVIFVSDQPRSGAVVRFLADKGWTLPVYHDDGAVMSMAFGQFGTPSYYVLDRAGRIRFNHADGELELVAQAEALREGI